jgi:hypothetical protein
MGFFAWAKARVLFAVCGGAAMVWTLACSGSGKKDAESAADNEDGPPPPCAKNEVREYFCDDLLPFNDRRAAPEPYQTCPSRIDVKGSVFPATSKVARFDVPRTEWTRKRVPPGHSCCYSWCSTLAVADTDAVDAAACQQPNAMRERLCVSTAEKGVSDAAAAPNDLCAAAITPPPAVAFTPPKAAALDLQATSERRGQGLSECCYGWCSKAPLGTGLGAK